jgi:hypothetical protein
LDEVIFPEIISVAGFQIQNYRRRPSPIIMAHLTLVSHLTKRDFWTSSHCRRWLLPRKVLASARERQRREGGFDDAELTLLVARPPRRNPSCHYAIPPIN